MNQEFRNAVWEVARRIPRGRVTTYGAIAKAIGYPMHSRHVGHSMHGCPADVPAHRVLGAGGVLRVEEFKRMLEAEGLTIVNMRVKNFKKVFWDPQKEIGL